MGEHDFIFIHALLLDVDRYRQVNRPASPAESQAHRASNKFGNSSDVMDHERTFGHRSSHADLIDFLLRALAQIVHVGAAGNGDHRAFAVHGVGQAGNRVGETRRGVHTNAGLLRDSIPGVRHVDRRLLVTRIDDAEILIRHYVQDRQDVIASQRKNIFNAFEFERFAD